MLDILKPVDENLYFLLVENNFYEMLEEQLSDFVLSTTTSLSQTEIKEILPYNKYGEITIYQLLIGTDENLSFWQSIISQELLNKTLTALLPEAETEDVIADLKAYGNNEQWCADNDIESAELLEYCKQLDLYSINKFIEGVYSDTYEETSGLQTIEPLCINEGDFSFV